jgi:hypothetical protein
MVTESRFYAEAWLLFKMAATNNRDWGDWGLFLKCIGLLYRKNWAFYKNLHFQNVKQRKITYINHLKKYNKKIEI